MADKKYSLVGRSYRGAGVGMVHVGAQGTLDQFKKWLGSDNFASAKKAGHFEEVKVETIDEPEEKKAAPAKGAQK